MLALAVSVEFVVDAIVTGFPQTADGDVGRHRLCQYAEVSQGLVWDPLQEGHPVFGIDAALLNLDGGDGVTNRPRQRVASRQLVHVIWGEMLRFEVVLAERVPEATIHGC